MRSHFGACRNLLEHEDILNQIVRNYIHIFEMCWKEGKSSDYRVTFDIFKVFHDYINCMHCAYMWHAEYYNQSIIIGS